MYALILLACVGIDCRSTVSAVYQSEWECKKNIDTVTSQSYSKDGRSVRVTTSKRAGGCVPINEKVISDDSYDLVWRRR